MQEDAWACSKVGTKQLRKVLDDDVVDEFVSSYERRGPSHDRSAGGASASLIDLSANEFQCSVS